MGSGGAEGRIVFRGISNITLDVKGRMAMPTRYREPLQARCNGQLMITIDIHERCLLLYPQPDWDVIEVKLDDMHGVNQQIRRVQRLLLGHATEVEMDAHGRLLLPPPLRQFAGLDRQCVLVGQGKKLELWDEAAWTERREAWLRGETSGSAELPPELESLPL